ncbi:MAG: Regulatory protein BlaR1 [Planctomycetota bacterium]|jgi:beta-lactamase regulating signal transducer with metallopeptidase domain
MTLTVLEYALGNALLALPLAALAWLIGRSQRNPSVAHFAWVLVMVRLVMPPIASVPWMSFKVPVSHAMVAQPIVSRASASPVLDPRIAAQRTDGLATHSMVAPAARAPAAVQAAAAVSATSNDHGLASVDRWMALGLLWLAGTSVVVTVSAARLLHFWRMLRVVCSPADPRVRRLAERAAAHLGMLLRAEILVIPATTVPFVWSFFGRPRIVLPASIASGMSDDELLLVLTHELAHIRRRDHLVRWLDWAVVAWLWWNPLAWIARRGLRRTEELACDALVLRTRDTAPRSYGSCLLTVAEALNESAFRAPVQACAMGDGGSLEERIRFIMSGASSSRPSMPLRLFAMAAASVSMLAGVACVSSGQEGLAAPSSAPRSAPAAPSSASAPQDADRTSRTLQASIEGATSLHVESLSASIKIVRDDSAKVMQVTAVIDWGDFTQGTNEWTVVNVGNGTTITVGQGTQRSRLSAAQRKELIDSAKLVAEKDSSGRVTVRVELPEADGWRQLPAVNITVRTAALIDVHAESMNGAIETAGDLGKLHVETVNGEINVSGIASALQAESMNGQVRISLADSAAASVDADCTNGRIVLELPASWSGEVNASTIHGRVDTKGIDGTTERDLSGGATFEGKVGSGNGAVATLDVVNGSIEVRKR